MPLTADEQYAANLRLLEGRTDMAGLAQQVRQLPLTNMQTLLYPSGHLFGAVWDVTQQSYVPLCNPQTDDPVQDAELAVAQMWTPQLKVFTMVGLGMGYAVAAFAKRLLPYQRLVVWDVDDKIFKAMLYALDVGDIFNGKRVEINVGTEVITRIEPWYLSLDSTEKLHMSMPATSGYVTLYQKPQYEAIINEVMKMLMFHGVGLSTWRQFGKCIGDNDLENLPEYFLNPGYDHLKDAWQGKPAVCIAAGPSLQKNLRHLLPPEVRSQLALITVGTTYGLVQGVGLEPDIVTTIDFQRLNWTDQFQHLPLDPDCTLVYLHSTYPQTVRRWPGPKFVAENSSDTVNWMRQYGEGKGNAAQVQTVAHLNLLVALEMGANPIILLGQDLSMPIGEHHAAGARAQDIAPGEAPQEAFVEMKDFAGNPVKTRYSFLSMLQVFERIIAAHPETTFLNCSEQGLEIKGAQHLPLREALAMLPHAVSTGVAYRPLFQGDTSGSVAAASATPSLRAVLRTRFQAYHPQIKPELYDDVAKLRREIDELVVWAREVKALWQDASTYSADWLTAAERGAMLASDCCTLDETALIVSDGLYQQILVKEKLLQQRPTALSLFAIRRFDFLELMAEVPPPAADVATTEQQHRYGASRVARVAAIVADEAHVVQRLLRNMARRLEMAHKALRKGTEIVWWQEHGYKRAFAGQHYSLACQKFLKEGFYNPGYAEDFARLHMHCLLHTQQYAAALALMEAWYHFPGKRGTSTAKHAARIRAHLARYHADVRRALPAYFGETEQAMQPSTSTTAVDADVLSGYHIGLNGHTAHISHHVLVPVLPVPDEPAYVGHG